MTTVPRRTAAGTGAALVLAVLAGCSSSSPPSSSASRGGAGSGSAAGRSPTLSGSITVDAASSLTEPFTTLERRFERAHPGTDVRINFGASSELSTQIGQGAPVDVFASASEKNMDALAGQVTGRIDFVRNSLEIALPSANPARITALADLARPGVKVAVCDRAVPCGAVAQQVFRNAGIDVRPAASLADVKATLAAVLSNEVDAGLVYVTDVRAAGAAVRGIPIPPAQNASTTYPIAVVKNSENAALARAWLAFVTSPAGRAVLRAAGFADP
jgi:molybdate transport system substrate-binding protein